MGLVEIRLESIVYLSMVVKRHREREVSNLPTLPKYIRVTCQQGSLSFSQPFFLPYFNCQVLFT